VQLNRPATGRTWTAALAPALYPAAPPALHQTAERGHRLVQLPGFFRGADSQVVEAIQGLINGIGVAPAYPA
jgi:hypothetical protein